MNLVLNTPPADLAEQMDVIICDHLRRPLLPTLPPDYGHILQCGRAAVARLDGPKSSIRRALLTQHWSMFLDGFPSVITIPLSPLQTVTCIKFRDPDGAWQQVASAKYRVSAAHSWQPEIAPVPGEWWPDTQAVKDAVEVRFRAGFGDSHADIPNAILQAVLELAAHHYSERQPVVFGAPHELPLGVKDLLSPYRVFR